MTFKLFFFNRKLLRGGKVWVSSHYPINSNPIHRKMSVASNSRCLTSPTPHLTTKRAPQWIWMHQIIQLIIIAIILALFCQPEHHHPHLGVFIGRARSEAYLGELDFKVGRFGPGQAKAYPSLSLPIIVNQVRPSWNDLLYHFLELSIIYFG